MGGRRACTGCGATYHVEYAAPAKEGVCDKCGEALVLRDDDKAETVSKRLEVYHSHTQPLIKYYTDLGVLYEFDGTGDIDEIFGKIKDLFGE